jgi:hypothetical protein
MVHRRIQVGLISDTHGLLRPEAFDSLRGSDFIVHAGDIGFRLPVSLGKLTVEGITIQPRLITLSVRNAA